MCILQTAIHKYISDVDVDFGGVMTEEDINNFSLCLMTFLGEVVPKYIKGKKEHGGNILDADLKKEIKNEVLDLVVYVYHQQLKEGLKRK